MLLLYHSSNEGYSAKFIEKIVDLALQGSPHIPTGFCRRFTAFICMIQKIAINICLRSISNLLAQEKSTSYDENCSNAIAECNTGQISRARQPNAFNAQFVEKDPNRFNHISRPDFRPLSCTNTLEFGSKH